MNHNVSHCFKHSFVLFTGHVKLVGAFLIFQDSPSRDGSNLGPEGPQIFVMFCGRYKPSTRKNVLGLWHGVYHIIYNSSPSNYSLTHVHLRMFRLERHCEAFGIDEAQHMGWFLDWMELFGSHKIGGFSSKGGELSESHLMISWFIKVINCFSTLFLVNLPLKKGGLISLIIAISVTEKCQAMPPTMLKPTRQEMCCNRQIRGFSAGQKATFGTLTCWECWEWS